MTITAGSVGLYPAEDGTIYVTFKKGDPGLPVEDLLPASGRGDGFESFSLAGYFDYAHLWFATTAQMQALSAKIDESKLLPGETTKVSRIPIDFEAYDLLGPNGSVDNKTIKAMFLAIASLWEQAEPVKPIAGLFHKLYQQGMPPHKISTAIRAALRDGAFDENGELDLSRVNDDPATQIFTAAFRAYRQYHGLDPDGLFEQSQIDAFATLWSAWTRSINRDHKSYGDGYLMWQDYRRLHLFDAHGDVNERHVEKLTQTILDREADTPNFKELADWADGQFEQQVIAQAKASKSSQKALRKKRKAGRVNRKRGRR